MGGIEHMLFLASPLFRTSLQLIFRRQSGSILRTCRVRSSNEAGYRTGGVAGDEEVLSGNKEGGSNSRG